MSSENNSNAHNTIFNVSDYQSAKGLTDKAQAIFNNILKAKSPPDKASAIAELENRLAQLKSAIDAKKPYTYVMLIIHTKVHPSIMNAGLITVDAVIVPVKMEVNTPIFRIAFADSNSNARSNPLIKFSFAIFPLFFI
jgi:hypothetical protein